MTDEDKEANKKLPGMEGIYISINFALYHFAGNNPVKYTDPDGRIVRELDGGGAVNTSGAGVVPKTKYFDGALRTLSSAVTFELHLGLEVGLKAGVAEAKVDLGSTGGKMDGNFQSTSSTVENGVTVKISLKIRRIAFGGIKVSRRQYH